MQKVITGPPRAGKTYWAVRHVLVTYFKWDNELFTWVPKSDKTPFILTNIDGLRIPHVNLDVFLKQQGCTLADFLTLDRVVPFIEKIGVPFVLLLDEAHGTFPFNFKDKGAGDPQKSTLYFFGYHGHYPIDIYLITHSWTDLCPSIAQRAEYQIDAERRTLSAVGEFRYFYLHPKTQEKLNTQVVKSDKKIHMMYLSSNGEHKTNEIKPIRKQLYIILALCVVSVFFFLKFMGHFGNTKNSIKPAPRPAVRAGAGGASVPVVSNMPVKPTLKIMSAPVQRSYSSLKPPAVKKQSYVQVSLAGAWFGDKLVAVDLFGQVVPISELPYSYSVDRKNRRALVSVPDDVVAALRPGLWVDNSRVLQVARAADPAPPSPAPVLSPTAHEPPSAANPFKR
ncbi:hypothetical protein KP003_09125 [Geomonas nitrogeniifigens]|uniref:zonular occludens toxin domain-containing protein n=1 Tax=Geomonas diazotrophica TaxID=2843197 RepID=UPI001C2C4959|nr:zonular occludens toxin domain-containing protein [Geomonas nitrogeniifigens]QXE88538.1 hypothetical protein KP003_09125 [Geomonas nitrogeniifigens]